MEMTSFHRNSQITADVAANNAFYTRVLNLRSTWKTMDFDDRRTYDFRYGDRR
jgi:catechol 2,3-dioxygenase-like lactoylglutathione lyase family enzyme